MNTTNILLTYIGPISNNRDSCSDIEYLKVFELIPLCIYKDIEKFYIEFLEILRLIERKENRYQILNDIFYKDPDYYSNAFLEYIHQIRVDIAIIPSFLSLAKHLYYEDKELFTLPNVANVLLFYNKGVLNSFGTNRINAKYIVYIDNILSNLYSEKQFKYGYKKMYIVESFDYLFHDIKIPIILFIKNFQKELLDLVEEIISINNKLSIGIDMISLGEEEIDRFVFDIATKKSFLLIAISRYSHVSQFMNMAKKLDRHITCIVALTDNYFIHTPSIEEVSKEIIRLREALKHYKIIQ
ncbi:hypothetical protein Igag_1468 [Ignisphaera aggregans DSM 17230]|uniref:Uncharacterized protein n=1 Tax=Ignisphaera aggregans (strain DSM 17230 / JCM 13409 / AQ1.S1) TaxID=583356 RepID=E0SQL4_IGNAA|nr:hypothetical protein Igag_1468 [Ignisphaera aggregans DSM 17230]